MARPLRIEYPGAWYHIKTLIIDLAPFLFFGLSQFMRRFLTGYVITYNNRHGRHGHLFQNRYKSIVCDEDEYFLELVRYTFKSNKGKHG